MATSCTPDTPITKVTVPPLSITTSAGKRLSRECPDASCPDGGGNGDPRSSLPNSIVADRAEGVDWAKRLEPPDVGLDGTGLCCAQELPITAMTTMSTSMSLFMAPPGCGRSDTQTTSVTA